MNSKYTIYHHIVHNSPPKIINKFIKEYDKSPVKKKSQAIEQVKSIIREEGEPALIKLVKIHPDRKLLKKSFLDDYSNFGGCPICSHSSADGNEKENDTKKEEEENLKEPENESISAEGDNAESYEADYEYKQALRYGKIIEKRAKKLKKSEKNGIKPFLIRNYVPIMITLTSAFFITGSILLYTLYKQKQRLKAHK